MQKTCDNGENQKLLEICSCYKITSGMKYQFTNVRNSSKEYIGRVSRVGNVFDDQGVYVGCCDGVNIFSCVGKYIGSKKQVLDILKEIQSENKISIEKIRIKNEPPIEKIQPKNKLPGKKIRKKKGSQKNLNKH